MKAFLRFPMFALMLAVLWLALNESFAPSHLLLGAAVAITAVLGFGALQEPQGGIRRLGVALELLGLVIIDVVQSNIAVARIVIGGGSTMRKAGFAHIPLDMCNPIGLAALACIITSTPGTAWAGYDSKSGVLTMHILDIVDEKTWVQTIKTRYERRLMEIFG